MAQVAMSLDEKAVWNERTKLTCTALNNIAVATVVTGTIVPLISGVNGSTSAPTLVRVATLFLWLAMGMTIHVGALTLMRRVRG